MSNLVEHSGEAMILGANTAEMALEKAKQLPKPVGEFILCAIPEVDKTFENGLFKADSTRKTEEQTSVVLFVMALGPMAYKDVERFPEGPWCQEGDFVVVRAYTGTRLKIHGREFRLITDNQIEAVVEDPRGISRA